MGILDFFEKSAGKWFSQRTSYKLGQQEQWHQSDKTNLYNELLPADVDEVIQLCERCRVSPSLAIGGLRTRWEKTHAKPAGSSLLVALNDESTTQAKQGILRGGNNSPIVSGLYYWGSDQTLVIVTEASGCTTEERLWFNSDNLRLRTSLMKFEQAERNVSSFYSEIRMGVAAPAIDSQSGSPPGS
ncbi:MAG: phycobiliprotein lyase [Prochlorotrichaceae cyanobacterium]|jgi:hypothetical protein